MNYARGLETPFSFSSFSTAADGLPPNYFLLHPLEPVPEIYRESEFFDRGHLRIHWLARYPDRQGKLPAVLVHPDRVSLSKDMEGICLALARRGFFAAAVDYQRLENLEERNPLLPCRTCLYFHQRQTGRIGLGGNIGIFGWPPSKQALTVQLRGRLFWFGDL